MAYILTKREQDEYKEGWSESTYTLKWADNMKWSDQLHVWKENIHIQSEDGQITWNVQVDFTERATTKQPHTSYGQKTYRQLDPIEWQRPTYILRMGRKHELVRSTLQDRNRPHTYWGWADDVKWSVRLHRRTETNHIHSENGQTTWNGQLDFTEGRRPTTYTLRMGRQREMVS